MNILFTTHQGGIAGSTYSVYYLVMGLIKRGHEIHVACPENTLLAELIENLKGATHHTVEFTSYLDIQSIKRIKQIVIKNEIDLINAQSGRDRNNLILAKHFFGMSSKIIFTRRQRPRNEPWLKRKWHLSAAKKIVVVSEGLRTMFLGKGYLDSAIKVINNGVPSDISSQIEESQIEKLRAKLKLQYPVIGCVGRLKKQEQLIAALAYLPDNLTVLFIGITRKELAIDLTAIKQRIIFTGRLSYKESLHYFKLLDLNTLPSVMDGFGLVLVESMLLGIPVIGTNRGGIPSVIEDGKSGLLFENGDVEQMARKINKILTDQNLRNTLITEGYQRAKHFSIEETVKNYELFFMEVIDGSYH